ncbi:helix-turn-helix domain-containing protein [Agromyces sp. CFH 90414]|uniref:Helix-turn-helix domain-containing protein n=1 Tax=Agromyces agglutinans TaxID=2662258 RepID=A0A6I2F7T2_9MICO|nr:IclR family transcriptional regulator [Agromyces agglutinans]MRG60669.1 helix-turn-helix domain-containing protein [Agromyces agglutinans]
MRGGSASDAVGVLDRMTAILEAFDHDDRGLGISELALRAGLPKSTVSRLVATLVRQRYLERDGKHLRLGLRVFELGQLAEQPRDLRAAALPVMAELRHRTGGHVHLAIRDRHEMVCIAVMRGNAPAQPIARIGGRLPIHATALGRAVLAHASAASVDEAVAAGLTALTPRTITAPDALRRQLAAVRRSGIAVDVEEFAVGVSCAASPVFAPSGALVAALSVSGRTDRFDADATAAAVRDAAFRLGRRLGGDGPPRG